MRLQRFILFCSFLYVGIVLTCVVLLAVVPTSVPSDQLAPAVGCYYYDALLVAVSCQGFSGSLALTALLNFPFVFVYAPMFVVMAGADRMAMLLLAVFVSAVVWSPVAYLLYRFGKSRVHREFGVRPK
jgi:hypothetical protein